MRPVWILVTLIAVALSGVIAHAQDTAFAPVWEQIPGPDCAPVMQWNSPGKPRTCSAAQIAEWLADIRHWRTEHWVRMGYETSQYGRPELKWTQSSFVQPQMMVEDRYFYDSKTHPYTVGRYLEDLKRRYGGIDSVLVWPTYLNIGIDDRNTDDMFRSMPGGIPGIRRMVQEFHRAGVK